MSKFAVVRNAASASLALSDISVAMLIGTLGSFLANTLSFSAVGPHSFSSILPSISVMNYSIDFTGCLLSKATRFSSHALNCDTSDSNIMTSLKMILYTVHYHSLSNDYDSLNFVIINKAFF